MARSAQEHRDVLERELTHVGLKPRVQITDGGHLRINFTVNGHERFIITARTPSDHRSTMNARARIRQVLRADGYVPPVQEKPTLLTKALSVPPPAEPLHERIEKLQEDISALLDMIVANAKPEDLTPVTKATAPVAEAVPPRTEHTRGKARRIVLLALEYQWTAYADITRNCRPMTDAHVSVVLSSLKKDGLVERDDTRRGFWRKVIQKTQPYRNGHEHHASASL